MGSLRYASGYNCRHPVGLMEVHLSLTCRAIGLGLPLKNMQIRVLGTMWGLLQRFIPAFLASSAPGIFRLWLTAW